MSRIGKNPVVVPNGVKVEIANSTIRVEGPKGKLDFAFRPEITVNHDATAQKVMVTRANDERQARALHGLTRAIIQNMMVGVTQGYEKKLEIVGVGYLGGVLGKVLQIRAGYANE